MGTTFKILLVAAVLSLTFMAYVFDLHDANVEKAQDFIRAEPRVTALTGEVESIILLPLARRNAGPKTRMFFWVRGEDGVRTVQVTDQDSWTGQVRRYCISNAGCHYWFSE